MKTESIESHRLILVPATLPQMQADLSVSGKLGQLLRAEVPDNWPPEILRAALPVFFEYQEKHPESFGWLMWYCLLKNSVSGSVLVGSIGFKGRPSADGTVEVGYSVLPQFWGKGLATEAGARLIKWAFQHQEVERVIAETRPENIASRHVLEKLNFYLSDEPANEDGHLRYILAWIDFAKSNYSE
jgi:RimJ/RimL family protein N-acetyltransferase